MGYSTWPAHLLKQRSSTQGKESQEMSQLSPEQ